jgi:hypothetical protein
MTSAIKIEGRRAPALFILLAPVLLRRRGRVLAGPASRRAWNFQNADTTNLSTGELGKMNNG